MSEIASSISDSVERLLAEWRVQRPDLDFSPVEVITRLQRVRNFIDNDLDASFASAGLTGPVFFVLSVLRRQGEPFTMSQRVIAERLGLTAGTVSVRIDQLVELGFVTRAPDPNDRRGTHITLTESGLARVDAWLPTHLAHEERLLAALTRSERTQLAGLLRKILVAFETGHGQSDPAARLGVTLAPAHVALELRRAVGLPDRPGLLVRSVQEHGPAAAAGIREGDLLVAADRRHLCSILDLEDALRGRRRLKIVTMRGSDEHAVAVVMPGAEDRSAAGGPKREPRGASHQQRPVR